ncbi:twin-arginine translocase TatA/TatE family subunit [Natronococcus sp. JC468]|uniref:Sec-independent protein translocase subunit TatA/TatB n=1 Tax=Natronococcus sp. JC468 TaxID=1961921 RepID=UPI001FD75A9A|nr:twin-arginine translocase TatA/TatE family subunit [Natronococcus sp. JC468]
MSSLVPMFMMPGGPELLIILFIAVLLFGTAKIPGLARAAGESMGEFEKGRVQVERELEEMRTAARERAEVESEETERTAD